MTIRVHDIFMESIVKKYLRINTYYLKHLLMKRPAKIKTERQIRNPYVHSVFIILLSLFSLSTFGQSVRDQVQRDTMSYIYELNNAQLKYIYKNRKIQDTTWLFTNKIDSCKYDRFDKSKLKNGCYLRTEANQHKLTVELVINYPFEIETKTIKGKHLVYLKDIKTKDQIKNAVLLVKDKRCKYDSGFGAYVLEIEKEKKKRTTHNLHIEYRGKDYYYYLNGKKNYVKKPSNSNKMNTGPQLSPGYFLVSQPKYRLLDTVKFKAFLVNRFNGKPIRKKAWLSLKDNRKTYWSKKIKSKTKGAYFGDFVLPDSLKIDKEYKLKLNYYQRGYFFYSEKTFKLEDYQLDKNEYKLIIPRDTFYAGEPVNFYAKATDANGFNLSDTRLNVKISVEQLIQSYDDTIIFRGNEKANWYNLDTVMNELEPTKISLPKHRLLNGLLKYKVVIDMKDQRQEKKSFTRYFYWEAKKESTLFVQRADTIVARHTHLLKDTAKEFDLFIYQNNRLLDSSRITTPYKKQIEFNYTKAILQETKTNKRAVLSINQTLLNLIQLKTTRTHDSVKVDLSCPLQNPIHYKIYRNEKEVASGAKRKIQYKAADNTDAAYYLLFSSNINGQLISNYQYFKIGQDKKKLHITTNLPEEIYPGHTQAIEITVKDYKGQSKENINLTSYAVSSMFKNDLRQPHINMPKKRIPQLEKVTLKKPELEYNTSKLTLSQSHRIEDWMVKEFNLHKNDYYKIYHSLENVYAHHIPFEKRKKNIKTTFHKNMIIDRMHEKASNPFCEIAVLPILENEITRPSFVKIDGQLIYHNNIGANLPYSAMVKPGKHTLEFRFQDKLFKIDNIIAKDDNKTLVCVRLDSILERKNSSYIIKDSLPSYAMTTREFNTLDSNSIFAYGLSFDTLKVYPLNNERNAIYYFGQRELGRIQVRDENFRVISLPVNSKQNQFVLDMGKIKKMVTNKTKEAIFFYDKKEEYKTYDSTSVPFFGAGRKRISYFQLLDVVNNIIPPEAKTAVKKTATPEYKQNNSTTYRELYSSPLGRYIPVHTKKGYVSFKIKSNDSAKLIALWLINKSAPNLSSFHRIANRYQVSTSHYGRPDIYDIYFVYNNKTFTLFQDHKLRAKEQWIVNADLLPKQAIEESSFTEPILLFNQLTKTPMEPFVSYPDESNMQVKVIKTKKRSTAMLNGIVRNSNGSILQKCDVYLEKNGRFHSGATTNRKGEFEFLNIPKGNYMLKVFVNTYRPRYAYNIQIKENAVYSYTIELKGKNTFVPDLMVNQNELQLRVFQATENDNLKSFGNIFDMDSRAPMSNVKIEVVRKDGKKLANYRSSITGRFNVYSEQFVDSAYHIMFSKAGYRSLVLENVELYKTNINQMQVFLRIKNTKSSLPIIIDLELNEKTTVWKPDNKKEKKKYRKIISTNATYSRSVAGGIDGKIVDQKGEPIPFASIGAFQGGILKGQGKSNFNGNYKIKPLNDGTYTLKVSSVGWHKLEVQGVYVKKRSTTTQNIVMSKHSKSLKKVMIVSRKRMIDATNPGGQSIGADQVYSISSNAPLRALSTMAGVDNGGQAVYIGGGRSDETMYLIDGMMVRGSSAINNIPSELIRSVDSYRSSNASKIGNATGGVIELKKKGFNLFKAAKAKSLRTKFSNLGYWIPNMITNKEGKAYATITFPDDVTRWRAYVVGMGRDYLNGVHTSSIKSYKPIMVNSIVPRFLYQSDKLEAKAKFVNFDSVTHNVQVKINIDNQEKINKSINLKRNYIDSVILNAGDSDTLVWRAELDLDTYYKDGEEISIPVFKDGLETVDYTLVKLDKDSSKVFDLKDNEKTTIYFNNTILENILVEVNKLKNYPYACNEQKASKIKGLLVEERIREKLKQKFEHKAMLKSLINRLERSQKPNGSWSWWSNGSANQRMTLYITEVLQEANKKGYNNSASLLARDYIKKNIKRFNTSDKVYGLYLLKKMNVPVNYDKLMADISYYDLNLCSKLYYLSNTHTYKNQLSKAKLYDCLSQLSAASGSRYSSNFFYDPSANMALALKLLKNTGHENHVTKSLGPFLSSGKFIANSNTFSKVYLIEAWLESMSKENTSLVTELIINDTIRINKFPYVYTTTQANVKIEHTGATVYTSFVHEIYKANPKKIDSLFDVRTKFVIDNNTTVEKLKKGVDVNMDINIMSFRTGKNIMIEIPIPSSCTYNGKAIPRGNISHIEYYKNKAIFYIENLNVGETKIRLPLRVNFSGDYSVPPTRASLMYYPFKTGNNTKIRVLVD